MNPFNLIVDLMGQALAFFYSIVPSYGIAIIFLTLVISFALFPLTLKQARSMKAMQEIQPEVKKLQKEYKDNKEEMQKHLMALYSERGVNPAAGCLPLIVQMPIWFALFRVLRITPTNIEESAIPVNSELADALSAGETGFAGMDLLIAPSEAVSAGIAGAIPYLLAVILVMGAGYYQQHQTMARSKKSGSNEPVSQQMQGVQTAMKFMPLFFGFISWGFPAGLLLYWITSNLFRIGQQAVIFGLDEKRKAEAAAISSGDVSTTSTTSTQDVDGSAPATPPQGKPSPNASKKRKKRRRN